VQLTNGGAAGRSALTDLLLYRLTTEPVGVPAVTIAATPPAAGTPVTMIGSGRDRGGFTEWSVNEATTPWTWTPVPSGGDYAGYGSVATRQMRWGTNAISDDAGPSLCHRPCNRPAPSGNRSHSIGGQTKTRGSRSPRC